MRVEVVDFDVHVFPEHVDEVVFVDDPVWVLRKDEEQLVLFWRQAHGLVIEDNLMPIEIDDEVFELDDLIILKISLGERDPVPDPGNQLLGLDRFDQEIIRTDLESFNAGIHC